MFFKGLSGLSSLWSQDMAIDLGTANTLVVLKDQLRASLAIQTQDTQTVAIENAITTLQDEAWEEYGEKIQ